MKLSEIKGEKAIEVMADLMEPLARIFADKAVQEAVRAGEPKLLIGKKLLKGHAKEIIEVLAILDGDEPKTYAEKVNLMTLPNRLVEMMNDPLMADLFTSLDQKTE